MGWGRSQNSSNHEDLPRKASVESVTDGECFEKRHDLGRFYTRKMFCVKGLDGFPCQEDSGRYALTD